MEVWDPSRRLSPIFEDLIAVPVLSLEWLADSSCRPESAAHNNFEISVLHDNRYQYLLNGMPISVMDVVLPPSKKQKQKSPRELFREELQKVVLASRFDWTEEISADLPRSWEIHGDLVLLPQQCFRNVTWNDIGRSAFFFFFSN